MKKQKMNCEVIMLPTKHESNLAFSLVRNLHFSQDKITDDSRNSPQFIYFASKHKIVAGSWFLTDDRYRESDNNGVPVWVLLKCSKVENGWIFSDAREGEGFNPDWCRLVVATNNPIKYSTSGENQIEGNQDWNVPSISLDFLKKYADSYSVNVITNVGLECDEQQFLEKVDGLYEEREISSLKLDKDGNVVVCEGGGLKELVPFLDIYIKHSKKLDVIRENSMRWREENWSEEEVRVCAMMINILSDALNDFSVSIFNSRGGWVVDIFEKERLTYDSEGWINQDSVPCVYDLSLLRKGVLDNVKRVSEILRKLKYERSCSEFERWSDAKVSGYDEAIRSLAEFGSDLNHALEN